jgi:hypothetical protein
MKSTQNSAFFDTHHEGVWKNFVWTPLMCQCTFLRPRQGERAGSKKLFLPVSHFLHQNETTAGWQDPKITFSLKINSPYWTSSRMAIDFSHRTIHKKSITVINNLSLDNSRRVKIADFCWYFASIPLNLPNGEKFLPYGEKNLSPCGNLSRTRTGLGVANPVLFEF